MLRSPMFRQAARVGALLVLAWTALDLSSPRLCALDQERLPAPMHRSADDRHPVQPEDDATHFDDCFCCSHCVEPSFVFHVTASTEDAGWLAPRATRPPSKLHPSLYHPPRIAG